MPSRRGRRAAEAPVLLVLDDDEEDGGDDKEVGAQRDNDLDDELVVLLSDDEQPAPQFACTQPGCSRVFKRAAHLAVHAKSHRSAAAKPAPTVTRKQKQPPPPLPPPIDIAADLLPSDDDVDAAAQAADLPEDLAMILRGSPVDAEKTKKKKKKTTKKKKKKKKRRTSQAVNLLDMNKPSIFVRQQADSDDDQSSDNGDDDNDAGSGVLSLFGARGRKRSRPSSTRARRSDDEGSNDAASEQDDSELAVEPLPVSSESDTDALFDSLRREVDRAVVTAGPASSVAASLITKTLDTVVEAYAAPSDDADGRKSKRSSKRRSNDDDDDDDVKGGSNELVCDIAVKDTAGKQLHAPLKMRYLIDKPVGGIVDIVANWFSFSPAGAKLCFDALPVENERTLRDIGMVEGDVLEVVFPAAAAAAASDSERGAPITVVVQSNVGEKTSFTLRMNDAFQLLFNAFCKKNGYYADDVVLLFEGERLSLTDTPALLDLDGDEVFDARVKTDASGKPRQCIDSTTTTTTTTAAAAGKKISVGVLLPGGRTTQLRVGAEQRFALLLTELARRQGVAADKIELRLEGEPLPLDRTPRDLDFEGGETIEALIDGPTNPCAEQDDDSDNDEEEEQEDDRAQAEEDAAEGKITLYLQTKTERQSFRMGTTKTFDKLVEAFRARNASVARTAKIALFLDGDKLQLDDTPEDMDLEDEDVIDVRVS